MPDRGPPRSAGPSRGLSAPWSSAPGDLLLGLTDGVVERRGFDLDEGLAELVACVRGDQGSLDDLVERVTTTMLGRTLGRDDATLLAVRFTPDT